MAKATPAPVINPEEEKKELIGRYRGLLKSCRRKLDKNDKLMIRKAFDVAMEAHQDVRRKSGEPYIYHPILSHFLSQYTEIVDFLLSQKMPDGGFNCFSNRQGAVHSSLHTTLSVLEGISEYEKNGYTYRLKELIKSKKEAIEFILIHKLFRSHRTGEIINPNFLKLIELRICII